MSRLTPERLKEVAEHAVLSDPVAGSLYLRLLACCYLGAPDEAEPTLGHEFHVQCEAEQVDCDDVLTDLLLSPEGSL